MKKLLAILLALCLIFSMAACAAMHTVAPAQTPSEPTVEASTETAVPEEAPAAEPLEEAEPAIRAFTDSLGRTVELPAQVTKIAVSGPMAQLTLFALCPDLLVGISSEWDAEALPFIDETYLSLPTLGQIYGGKEEVNLETLLASGAEVVIDVGEPKDSAAEDLDALQEQLGFPCVHVTMALDTIGDAYRMLGELVGMPEEAEALASYCNNVYAETVTIPAG